MQVKNDSTVVMHFNMYAQNGEIAKSTYGEKPVKFTYGDGSFSEFFENALVGLSKGAKKTVMLEPDDAFGNVNPRNVQPMPRERFAQDMQFEKGLVVEFNQGGKGRLYGIVQDFNDKTVVIDFNHPLAGQRLRFDIEIVDILESQSNSKIS